IAADGGAELQSAADGAGAAVGEVATDAVDHAAAAEREAGAGVADGDDAAGADDGVLGDVEPAVGGVGTVDDALGADLVVLVEQRVAGAGAEGVSAGGAVGDEDRVAGADAAQRPAAAELP